MKNKKNIYFLLSAVIMIWGLLGYRIYNAAQPQKSNATLVAANKEFTPFQLTEERSFSIKANYRDPFLGTITVTKKLVKKRVVRKVTKKPKLPFPKVIYKGFVGNQNSKVNVFIVTINGNQFFFKRYQTHDDVKLINGNAKSVTLKFQGQKQTFSLAK